MDFQTWMTLRDLSARIWSDPLRKASAGRKGERRRKRETFRSEPGRPVGSPMEALQQGLRTGWQCVRSRHRPLREAGLRSRLSMAGNAKETDARLAACKRAGAKPEGGWIRMPVRAPVKKLAAIFGWLEAETSDAKFSLFGADHALVRVGSAAMPAPFALCAADFPFLLRRASRSHPDPFESPLPRPNRCRTAFSRRSTRLRDESWPNWGSHPAR